MIYYEVPFSGKDEAKRLGARWNGTEKLWYSTSEKAIEQLDKRFQRIDFGDVTAEPITTLIGEDRLLGGNSLFVDLIPRSCFFTNARSSIKEHHWRRLSRGVRGRARNKCEVCDHR